MAKWKAVRIKQELVDEVKKEVQKTEYKALSEFVSDAVQQRLQTLAKQRVTEYLERDRNTRTTQIQTQLFYTPKHTWVRMAPQGTVEIGITEYFQNQLKEIVNIRTSNPEEYVSKDEPFGVAESWWFTYDLHSPVDGKIVEINEKVIEDPFILNVDPTLWIVKIQPKPAEASTWMKDLLSPQQYQKLVAGPNA